MATDHSLSHHGRVTLITGAGAGLGAELAESFARARGEVVVNNRHRREGEPSAEKVARTLRDSGLRAWSDTHAIDDPGAAQAIVESIEGRHGRLDTLVLNAGVNGSPGRISAMDPADLAAVMAVNFFANASLVQAALPLLERSSAGRILFVSSTAGLHGLYGRAHYAASKGALTAYALTLAAEQRQRGIGANLLMPYAETAMTADVDKQIIGLFTADMVAPAALWLASPDCAATGEMWIAGGGHFRRAMVVETVGVSLARNEMDMLPERTEALADMNGAQAFKGGLDAFRSVVDAIRTE